VRRYPNGKLLIKPSKKNVGTFLKGIRGIINDARGMSAAALIEGLELGEGKLSRPVLRGPGGRKAAWLLGTHPCGRRNEAT
jgi:hypothetical protein